MLPTNVTANEELANCPRHQGEKITLYCRAHRKLGCLTCMTVSHKLCEIDEIADVSEKFLKEEEYANYEKCIDDLNETCGVNISKLEADIANIEAQYNHVIAEIKKRRKEVTDILDEIQSDLEQKAMTFKQENTSQMESLKEKYQSIAVEIEKTESLTSQLKTDKKYDLLFCEIKQARERIIEYQAKTYEMATSRRVQECKYDETLDLKTTVTKENIFGTIRVEDIKLGPCNKFESLLRKPVCHINIKADGDKKSCYATGLAFLSCDQLAIADKANRNVKIVDVNRDKVISEITLSSSPRDITVIPPDQLAVTLRDEKMIQLLSTASGLTKTSQIKTDGTCRGIHYDNGNLIVTFDNLTNPRIEVLNLKGKTLSSFRCNSEEDFLFTEPKCIGVSPDTKQIYVTDLVKVSLYRLTKNGDVSAVAKGRRFMGVAVSGGGSVFATSKSSDLVVKYEDDLSNERVVLNENDGIRGPIALAVDHAKNMLFVSCGRGAADICDKLHVFKIKSALQ
ncbi:uncharacterized protein LOC123542273 [Mercenaria mercenaria]|uniref:uncharacterized protein LOC123542273 n=1 Tax=Mercenaria mercenaria TaxID=6596 RepID=UPI00234EC687|nr:uncharacterized protein LOC123542273 [Mercenaria mercenaria]